MNELSLDVLDSLPPVGRPNQPIDIGEVRSLTPQDFLEASKFVSMDGRPVEKIRHAHHEMARLIASGMTLTEVSRVCGRSISHISLMQKNPAFQELIAYYQEKRTEDALEFERRIRLAASDGLDELSERLSDPDQVSVIPTKDLYGITAGLLDRAGHSPVSRRENRNLNIGLTGEDIRKIKEDARQGDVVEGEFSEVKGTDPTLEEGGEAGDS